jgi:hypothetical protein
MWNMKCFVILVIIVGTGIVSKRLKNLETIPGQHSIDSLQKKKRRTRNITHHRESATFFGFTVGSGGEVPGERKPVIREQHYDDNDDNNKSP